MEHAAEEAIQHNEDKTCTSEHRAIVYIHVIKSVRTHAVLVFIRGYRSTWFTGFTGSTYALANLVHLIESCPPGLHGFTVHRSIWLQVHLVHLVYQVH